MAKSNFHALDINFITALDGEEEFIQQVSDGFVTSPWYTNIVYVLQHLQAPPSLKKTKEIFLKLKSIKFCILDQALYWEDVGGILLNCLLEDEKDKMMEEFHEGDCEGHCFLKNTKNKISRASFYLPTLFSDVHKRVSTYHQCHIFERKKETFAFAFEAYFSTSTFSTVGFGFYWGDSS